jgi:hypothetical protein
MPKTSEGIEHVVNTDRTITNANDPKTLAPEARKVELHLNGVCYRHVSEDSTGKWVYRADLG